MIEDCEVFPHEDRNTWTESSIPDHWSVDVKYASDNGHM